MCEGCLMKTMTPDEQKRFMESYYKRYKRYESPYRPDERWLRQMTNIEPTLMPVVELTYGKKSDKIESVEDDGKT